MAEKVVVGGEEWRVVVGVVWRSEVCKCKQVR
jgi:hypothetical protein